MPILPRSMLSIMIPLKTIQSQNVVNFDLDRSVESVLLYHMDLLTVIVDIHVFDPFVKTCNKRDLWNLC